MTRFFKCTNRVCERKELIELTFYKKTFGYYSVLDKNYFKAKDGKFKTKCPNCLSICLEVDKPLKQINKTKVYIKRCTRCNNSYKVYSKTSKVCSLCNLNRISLGNYQHYYDAENVVSNLQVLNILENGEELFNKNLKMNIRIKR